MLRDPRGVDVAYDDVSLTAHIALRGDVTEMSTKLCGEMEGLH